MANDERRRPRSLHPSALILPTVISVCLSVLYASVVNSPGRQELRIAAAAGRWNLAWWRYNPAMPRAPLIGLFALLTIAVTARLLLQIAATPPYAGLDEGYHVARLAFVRSEARNPTMVEPSVPPYMATNLRGDGLLPSSAELRERWPEVVRARGRRIAVDRPFAASDLKPYVVPSARSGHGCTCGYALRASARRWLPRLSPRTCSAGHFVSPCRWEAPRRC